MDVKFSLSFFRKYFRIPRGVRLCWCILVEKSETGANKRLGVMLCGTNKVIDVAARCFVQIGLVGVSATYEVYPANRTKLTNPDTDFTGEAFVADSGESIQVSPTYVQDIYFRCMYSEEMMNQMLI